MVEVTVVPCTMAAALESDGAGEGDERNAGDVKEAVVPELYRDFYVTSQTAKLRVDKWHAQFNPLPTKKPETPRYTSDSWKLCVAVNRKATLDLLISLKTAFAKKRDDALGKTVVAVWTGFMLDFLENHSAHIIHGSTVMENRERGIFSFLIEHSDLLTDSKLSLSQSTFVPTLLRKMLEAATEGYVSSLIIIGLICPEMVQDDCYPRLQKVTSVSKKRMFQMFPTQYERFAKYIDLACTPCS